MLFLFLDLINFDQLFTARGKMNAKKLEKASLSERKKGYIKQCYKLTEEGITHVT